mmetsp:Transcript_8285/g.21999  ORF Transcript_8285/g.21999 Transcript_8285/m.21999 type:complete len:425 (+) Transcript_8285:614-1888(+)
MDDEPTVSTSSSHSHDAPSPSSTWASTLDDEDRRERIVNNLDEAIAKCVRREDFDAAAVLKRRKERVALSAPLCKLSRQLDDAISHEEYATAAQLHDTAALWMRGWWALRGGGTNGQLIRVDREGGRLVARSFSRVDLAGGPNVHVTPVPRVPLGKRGAPGVPVFEVHVRRCADGTVEAAPFVLGIPLEIAVGVGEDVRVRTASVELEGEGEKMDVRICFDMIPPFDYDDDDEEEDDDDDLEVMRMRAPRDDDDDDSDGGDDEEGGSLGIASTDDDDEDEDNPDDEEELERAIALSLVNSTSDAPSTSAPSRAADAAHAEEARKMLKLMRGGEGVGGVMAQHLINAARQCGLGVIADDPANANLMVAYAIACRDAGTFSVDALQAVQHANLDGVSLDASDIANMLADVEQAVLPKRKKTRKAKS